MNSTSVAFALLLLCAASANALTDDQIQSRCKAISGEPADFPALRRIVLENESHDHRDSGDLLELSSRAAARLLTDDGGASACSAREFVLRNVIIGGDLDISAFEIKKPIRLEGVTIKGTFKARNSHLVALTVDNSSIGYLEADGLNVSHDVSINKGCRFAGGFRMPFANVGGILSISGTEIYVGQDNERALNLANSELKGGLALHGSEIRGNLVLIQGSVGKLEVIGSTVGSRAGSSGNDRFAVSANWLSVNGPVLIDGKCTFMGNTIFLGAKVGGDFFIKSTSIFGCLDDVWVMDDASIGATLRIENVSIGGFENRPDPTEALRLKRIRISGDVDIQSTRIRCADTPGIAINADSLRCDGQFVIGGGNRLGGEVKLVGSRIEGNLEITSCQISRSTGKAVNADGIKVGQSVQLRKIESDAPVSFRSAALGNRLCLAHGFFSDLNLNDASTVYFQIEEGSWPSRLAISGFRYERIRLPLSHPEERNQVVSMPSTNGNPPTREQKETRTGELLSCSKKLLEIAGSNTKSFDPQPYEQLASVMRQMGNEAVARGILTEMSVVRASFSDCTFGEWLWYRWLGRIIGYGYNPVLPFTISVVLMVVGWIVFAGARNCGLLVDKDPSDKPVGTIFLQSLAYSVESFTPFFKLGLCEMWKPRPLPAENITMCHRWFLYYSWFHTAAGWILATLWIGALTGISK